MTIRGATIAFFCLTVSAISVVLVLSSSGNGSYARIELIFGLAALVLVVAYAFFIYGRVLGPIAMLDGAVRGLGNGKDGARIDTGQLRRDELGLIAEGINRFTDVMTEETCRCRNLLMALPDPVIETDDKGFIRQLNDAACAATGYSPDEVINKSFNEFVHRDASGHYKDVMNRIFKGESIKKLELPLILKGGGTDLFEFTCAPIWKEGRVTALRCIGRNIEERWKMLDELLSAKAQAEETSEKLKRTVKDLEEFALLAVRRESKMQEIRNRFIKLKQANGADKERPDGASPAEPETERPETDGPAGSRG